MARIAVLLVAFVFTGATGAWAEAPRYDEKTNWDWALSQIRKDKIADFGERCGGNPRKKLDPRTKTGWEDPCRRISAQFLVDELLWWKPGPKPRVRLRGVLLDGRVDLSDAEIIPEVWIDDSRIEGDLRLADSQWKRLLSLEGSTVTGEFFAPRLRTESAILLRNHAAVEGDVALGGAKIGGDLDLDSASLGGGMNLNSGTIGGDLFMRDAKFGGDLNLAGAKVAGNLEMNSSSFAKTVKAGHLSVDGSLYMREHATFSGEVNLLGAKIAATWR
jgi:hypothetical protein